MISAPSRFDGDAARRWSDDVTANMNAESLVCDLRQTKMLTASGLKEVAGVLDAARLRGCRLEFIASDTIRSLLLSSGVGLLAAIRDPREVR